MAAHIEELRGSVKANKACECTDAGCAGQHISTIGPCGRTTRTVILYRVDMHDYDGTRFCQACADDAMESGVFSTERNSYS